MDGLPGVLCLIYITITAHLVNQIFDFQNYTSQTGILRDSHTGLNLAQVLQTTMNEWRLKMNLPVNVTS